MHIAKHAAGKKMYCCMYVILSAAQLHAFICALGPWLDKSTDNVQLSKPILLTNEIILTNSSHGCNLLRNEST